MPRAPWESEFWKIPDKEVLKIKRINDKYYMGNEWLAYMYQDDGGRYSMGSLSGGGESQIVVSPDEHLNKDTQKGKCEDGVCEREDIAATIHAHPLKDGKFYPGRSYYSSTDIASDYARAVRGEKVVHFLVFPQPRLDGYHNDVRVLVLAPKVVQKAMKASNPDKDPNAVSEQNKGDYDWFKFQDEMGKEGYMGIIDIENTFGKKNDVFSAVVVIGLIVAAIGIGSMLKARGTFKGITLPGEK